MKTGVAIIGCGLIGNKRAASLAAADAELLAVHDSDEGRAQAVASAIRSAARVSATAKEAILTDGVELVVVATPNRTLAEAGRVAVDNGRHVLLEKPGAASLPDLLALHDAATARGVRVRIGFNHRFHPAVLKARELVAGDSQGRFLNLRGRYGHGGRLGYEHEWRMDRSVSGGGELLDQGVHLLDLSRFLVGDTTLAFGEVRTDFWPVEVEDNVFLALRAANGGFMWLHASWTEWKNLFSLELAYERAKIEMNGLGGSYGTETLAFYEMLPQMGPPATTMWQWPQADTSWERELCDVVAGLRGEPELGADITDGIAVMRTVEEAYRR